MKYVLFHNAGMFALFSALTAQLAYADPSLVEAPGARISISSSRITVGLPTSILVKVERMRVKPKSYCITSGRLPKDLRFKHAPKTVIGVSGAEAEMFKGTLTRAEIGAYPIGISAFTEKAECRDTPKHGQVCECSGRKIATLKTTIQVVDTPPAVKMPSIKGRITQSIAPIFALKGNPDSTITGCEIRREGLAISSEQFMLLTGLSYSQVARDNQCVIEGKLGTMPIFPAASFTLVARNTGGDSEPAPFTLEVRDALPALSYAPIKCKIGQTCAVGPQFPAGSGELSQYKLASGMLRTIGLDLNPVTGEVSGTAVGSLIATSVRIMAVNRSREAAYADLAIELTAPDMRLAAASSMKINPAFTIESLKPEARLWYARFLSAMRSPRQTPNNAAYYSTQGIQGIARGMGNYMGTLISVFRLTHDKAILDEVVRVMELARSTLKDVDGDGYLEWPFVCSKDQEEDADNAQLCGSAFHEMDSLMAYAWIAEATFALESNRALYAPYADFWKEHLKEFEKKWRSARPANKAVSFINKTLIHAYTTGIRLYFNLYRLSNNPDYLAEALARAKTVELQVVEDCAGRSCRLVWDHRMTLFGSAPIQCQALNYSHYTVQSMRALSLDGVPPFSNGVFKRKVGEMVREALLPATDNVPAATDPVFAGDICQERAVSWINPGSNGPETPRRVSGWSYSTVTGWDPSGDASKAIRNIYKAVEYRQPLNAADGLSDNPMGIYLPAGEVIRILLKEKLQ